MKCLAEDNVWHKGFNPTIPFYRDDIKNWSDWAKEHGLKEAIDLFHTYDIEKCGQCKLTAVIFCLAIFSNWNKIRDKS